MATTTRSPDDLAAEVTGWREMQAEAYTLGDTDRNNRCAAQIARLMNAGLAAYGSAWLSLVVR